MGGVELNNMRKERKGDILKRTKERKTVVLIAISQGTSGREGECDDERKSKNAATKYNWKGRKSSKGERGGRRRGGKEGERRKRERKKERKRERRRRGIKNKQFGKDLWYD